MPLNEDRRRFLQQAAAASAGVWLAGELAPSVPAQAPQAADAGLPIVDTHQHLWDLSKFRLPWTDDVKPLRRNFVMSDYLRATAGLNVVKTVYMEVDVDPSQQNDEARWAIETCRADDNPMVAAVISGRPASPGFEAYIRQYAGSPYIKGVRQVLHTPSAPRGLCLQEPFLASMRLLGKLNMSFDLCMRPTELTDAVKLIDACGDTRFILDHCGNERPDAKDHNAWRRDIAAVARRKNVVCKISGQVDKAGNHWKVAGLKPTITHALEVFGPQRVMFGGDWPVCTLGATFGEWVAALREIVSNESAENQRRLFHDNAVAFYGLKDKAKSPGH